MPDVISNHLYDELFIKYDDEKEKRIKAEEQLVSGLGDLPSRLIFS